MVAENNLGRSFNNVWIGYSFLGPWEQVQCKLGQTIKRTWSLGPSLDSQGRYLFNMGSIIKPQFQTQVIFSYPDLAISDYESDVVYLFKTKPTIRVKAWFPDLKTDTPIGGPEGGIQRYFGCGNEKCWKLCLRYEGVDHTGPSL